MKIVILGAGRVGTSVAVNLAGEANDITLVDTNAELLRELQDRLDIHTVVGYGSHPEVLERAGAPDADIVIAITNSDETNIAACQVAYTLFHTPTKIARVRAPEYLTHADLFSSEAMPIDVLISPENIVIDYIQRLLEYPGAVQVLDFADGRVILVGLRAYYGGPLVGHELRALRQHMPGADARVAAIYRRGRAIIPEGHTVIEPEDEVFVLAARTNIRAVMSELRRVDKPFRRMIFAGGGSIGKGLAAALEARFQIKIIEKDSERARTIAEQLPRTIVLVGDSADRELLIEENIENTDVFLAVTNDDQANILSAMLARRLGARRVMAIINRPAYGDLVESGDMIDVAISPQQATIGSLLTRVRRGDVVKVHALRHGAAEAIEAIAHGDRNSSKVVGRAIEEIKLPKGTIIGAIVRGEEVIMGHHDIRIEPEDHVILFMVDKKNLGEVEKLFQVAVTFL